MKKSIKNPLFKTVETDKLSTVVGGGTFIIGDTNPTATRNNPSDVCDENKSGWSCDSTQNCADKF